MAATPLEEVMTQEDIEKAAYARWEAEGHPEGQHERHWREAQDEITSGSADRAPLPSPDHGDDLTSSPSTDASATSSEAIPAGANGRGHFKPGELASENK